jgi:hypothetical protein
MRFVATIPRLSIVLVPGVSWPSAFVSGADDVRVDAIVVKPARPDAQRFLHRSLGLPDVAFARVVVASIDDHHIFLDTSEQIVRQFSDFGLGHRYHNYIAGPSRFGDQNRHRVTP